MMHEEAGSNNRRFQGGLMRDCDQHGVLLPSRRTAQGRGMRLTDFLADPNARNQQSKKQECPTPMLLNTGRLLVGGLLPKPGANEVCRGVG